MGKIFWARIAVFFRYYTAITLVLMFTALSYLSNTRHISFYLPCSFTYNLFCAAGAWMTNLWTGWTWMSEFSFSDKTSNWYHKQQLGDKIAILLITSQTNYWIHSLSSTYEKPWKVWLATSVCSCSYCLSAENTRDSMGAKYLLQA